MSAREPITQEEAFDGLPDEIRAAIGASNWQEKLRRLSKAHSLRVDQSATLEDETLRFMGGLQTVEEYAVHLAQELGLGDAEFKTFVDELEREIFQPIQGKLRDVLQPPTTGTGVASSVGEGESDDLEALLNEGDDALAAAAAASPRGATIPAPSAAAVPLAKSGVIGATNPTGLTVPSAAPVAPRAAALPNSLAARLPVATTASPVVPFSPAPSTPTPATSPAASTSTTPVAPSIAVPLASAAAKLAAPVTRPAQSIVANLQRPSTAPGSSSPSPSPTPAPADPYRESFS